MSTELQLLKKRIFDNQYVNRVRVELRVDEAAYAELYELLTQLAVQLKPATTIDKDLALVLYCIPQMIRNAMLSFDKHSPKPDIAFQLEDHWVELDGIVLECLSDRGAPAF